MNTPADNYKVNQEDRTIDYYRLGYIIPTISVLMHFYLPLCKYIYSQFHAFLALSIILLKVPLYIFTRLAKISTSSAVLDRIGHWLFFLDESLSLYFCISIIDSVPLLDYSQLIGKSRTTIITKHKKRRWSPIIFILIST